MINTLFDDITLLNYNHDSSVDQSLLHKLTNFSGELRIRYLELLENAELISLFMERMKNPEHQGLHTMTDEELLTQQYENHRPVLAYQDFVNCLNIHGRVLDKLGITIPSYYRIRFYRNKLIEHWDDYLDKSCNGISGWTARSGKIVVPFHSSKANVPHEGQPLWEIIKGNFLTLGLQVPFTWDDTISYERYTDFIWQLLEQIDPKLQTVHRYRIIPESLVELLYDYAMPVPILDMELYCAKLRDFIVIEVNKVLNSSS